MALASRLFFRAFTCVVPGGSPRHNSGTSPHANHTTKKVAIGSHARKQCVFHFLMKNQDALESGGTGELISAEHNEEG